MAVQAGDITSMHQVTQLLFTSLGGLTQDQTTVLLKCLQVGKRFYKEVQGVRNKNFACLSVPVEFTGSIEK